MHDSRSSKSEREWVRTIVDDSKYTIPFKFKWSEGEGRFKCEGKGCKAKLKSEAKSSP